MRVRVSSPFLRACALAAGLLLLAGCGSGGTDTSGTRGDASDQPISESPRPSLVSLVPASHVTDKTLNVGVALGSPPDEFKNDTGEFVGWEIDLIRAAAQTLGMTVKFTEAPFDSLIPGLQAGRYDAAIGQFGVTEQRKTVVDFVSTLSVNEEFAARTDTDIKVSSLADLCGRTVATTRGSREVGFADMQSPKCVAAGAKPINIQVFDDESKASLALMSKRVDVFWLGGTSVEYFVKTTDGQAKIVGSYLDKNPLGTALPKGSGMAEPLRAGVQATIESGTYMKILQKWGLTGGAITTSEVNPKVSQH